RSSSCRDRYQLLSPWPPLDCSRVPQPPKALRLNPLGMVRHIISLCRAPVIYGRRVFATTGADPAIPALTMPEPSHEEGGGGMQPRYGISRALYRSGNPGLLHAPVADSKPAVT